MKIINKNLFWKIANLYFFQRFLIFFFGCSLVVLVIIFLIFYLLTQGRIYPGVHIGSVDVGDKTLSSALNILNTNLPVFEKKSIIFAWKDKQWVVQPEEIQIIFESTKSAEAAFRFGRNGSWQENWKERWKAWAQGVFLPLVFDYNQEALNRILQQISQELDVAAINSSFIFKDGKIQTTPATAGRRINIDQLRERFLWQINQFDDSPIYFLPETVAPSISQETAEKAIGIVEKITSQPLVLKFGEQSWNLTPEKIADLITLSVLDQNHNSSEEQTHFLINPNADSKNQSESTLISFKEDKLDQFIADIAKDIDRTAQNAAFQFDQNRVTIFRPSKTGQKLEREKTKTILKEYLRDPLLSRIMELSVAVTQPRVTTGMVNDLGIRELIGRGISNFSGSIPNRIYNVNLTASKLNGVLVGPGETFSFNNMVGDISAATGFKQAYVIKEGRTVLDDGGGVCQDSTTLFRAVLNAGLPVLSRTAHAYRVGYYEQGFPPGLDATVFYPTVDFQFKNDTPGHILIQAYVLGNTLYIDLYGTADGRTVTLSKPVVTSQTPPPPDLRQDEPSLPRGTVRQVDWAAWGARVSFKRKVVRNGEILADETFYSNYRPWQAVYLVGTGE